MVAADTSEMKELQPSHFEQQLKLRVLRPIKPADRTSKILFMDTLNYRTGVTLKSENQLAQVATYLKNYVSIHSPRDEDQLIGSVGLATEDMKNTYGALVRIASEDRYFMVVNDKSPDDWRDFQDEASWIDNLRTFYKSNYFPIATFLYKSANHTSTLRRVFVQKLEKDCMIGMDFLNRTIRRFKFSSMGEVRVQATPRFAVPVFNEITITPERYFLGRQQLTLSSKTVSTCRLSEANY